MKRILITSALPYINGIKHLGNLVGSMLPADLFARYYRLCNIDVLFICATDEHGTPAEISALHENMSVEEYCEKLHFEQYEIYKKFNLSFDYFGRSSDQENHKLTNYFAKNLYENKYIEKRIDEQFYSLADKRFLPDRYIMGTCPKCGYERARGDQCDKCSSLLSPIELIDPYSSLTADSVIEKRKTSHLYLLQSKLQEKVANWLKEKKDFPKLTMSIANKWLKEGLRDRSITRDLSWGIKVDFEDEICFDMKEKVFYVWFDAPIAYISSTKNWASKYNKDWKKYWLIDHGADECEYIQFMGKDNVAFHTVSFPCTIIGSDANWKLVDKLKSLNWLTWYGGKFSTSENLGIFMDQAIEILPSDYWRWWLLRNAPETDDTSFTLEQFANDCNKDLADVLGNLVNRIYKFSMAKFEGVVQTKQFDDDIQFIDDISVDKISTDIYKMVVEYNKEFANLEIRKAAIILREIWAYGNDFIQKSQPWKYYKEDIKICKHILNISHNFILLLAQLSKPFIPDACEKIEKIYNFDDDFIFQKLWNIDHRKISKNDILDMFSFFKTEQKLQEADILFSKITDEQVAEWKEKFSAPL